MHRISIIPVIAAVMLAACADSPIEADQPQTAPSTSVTWPQKGVTHWKSFLGWDDETARDAAAFLTGTRSSKR